MPPPLTNLVLWLEADVGVYHDAGITPATDGQTVQQWNDQSGSGFNATQATAGRRPTYRANVSGLPAIQFTIASGTQMVAGGNTDLAAAFFSLFVVYNWQGHKNTSAAGQNLIGKGDGTSAGGSVYELRCGVSSGGSPNNFGTIAFETFSGTSLNGGNYVGVYAGSDQLIEGIRVSNTIKNSYLNGVFINTASDGGGTLNGGSTPMGIGDCGAATNLPFSGYIREILYYNVALSDPNRALVESYLMTKWGITAAPLQTMATFNTADGISGDRLYAIQSPDQMNWSDPGGVTNPTFSPVFGLGGSGTSSGTAGHGLLFYQSNYYWAYEISNEAGNIDRFGIAKSSSLAGPWTWLTDVVILPSTTNGFTWNPRWFLDDNNNIHIVLDASNSAGNSAAQPYVVSPTSSNFTTWGAPTLVTGTSFPAMFIDHQLISPGRSPNGLWNLFSKNNATATIYHSTSSSMTSGYTIVSTDVLGTAGTPQVEGVYLQKFLTNTWRMWVNYPSVAAWSYYDSADNWASWSVLPTKPIYAAMIPGGEALMFQFIPSLAMRRTLSPAGTRIGSRQVQGWGG